LNVLDTKIIVFEAAIITGTKKRIKGYHTFEYTVKVLPQNLSKLFLHHYFYTKNNQKSISNFQSETKVKIIRNEDYIFACWFAYIFQNLKRFLVVQNFSTALYSILKSCADISKSFVVFLDGFQPNRSYVVFSLKIVKMYRNNIIHLFS